MALLHGIIGFILGLIVGLVAEILYLRYKTAKHLKSMQDEMGQLMDMTDEMEADAEALVTDDED